jgi:hypothetical protein
MSRSYIVGSRSAWLVIVALANAACSDAPQPTTGPAAIGDVATHGAAAVNARGRSPYISNLQLSSIYVSLTDGYTPLTVTVTNPSQKSVGDIYIHGELKSPNNQPAWPATAFLGYCPAPNGVIPAGATCVMSNGITALGGLTLQPGPAKYTIQVLQQQSNGGMKVLDSKTVDVLLTSTVVIER